MEEFVMLGVGLVCRVRLKPSNCFDIVPDKGFGERELIEMNELKEICCNRVVIRHRCSGRLFSARIAPFNCR